MKRQTCPCYSGTNEKEMSLEASVWSWRWEKRMMLPFLLPQFCFFWTLLSFFLFDPDHMKLPHWSRKGKITLVCGQSSNVKIACFHGRREWSYL
jgi:hypothetical protein